MAEVSHVNNVNLFRPRLTRARIKRNSLENNISNKKTGKGDMKRIMNDEELAETEKLLENIRFEEKLAKLDLENLIVNYDANKEASFMSDDTEIKILKATNFQRNGRNSKSKIKINNSQWNFNDESANTTFASTSDESNSSTIEHIENMKKNSRENAIADNSKTSRLMNLYKVPQLDSETNAVLADESFDNKLNVDKKVSFLIHDSDNTVADHDEYQKTENQSLVSTSAADSDKTAYYEAKSGATKDPNSNSFILTIDEEKEQLEYEKLQLRYDQKVMKKQQDQLDEAKKSFERQVKDFKELKKAFLKEVETFKKIRDAEENSKMNKNKSVDDKMNKSINQTFHTALASLENVSIDNVLLKDAKNAPHKSTKDASTSPLSLTKDLQFENLDLKVTIKNQNMKIQNLVSELLEHKAYIETLEGCLNNVYKDSWIQKYKKHECQRQNQRLRYVNEFLVYSVKNMFVEHMIKSVNMEGKFKAGKILSNDSEISKIFENKPLKKTKVFKSMRALKNTKEFDANYAADLLRHYNLGADLGNIFTNKCCGIQSKKISPLQKFRILARHVVAIVRLRTIYAAANRRDGKVYAMLKSDLI